MNLKEIALRLAKSMRDKSGYTTLDLVCNAEAFAEALVAELAKENEPVAWYDGNKFYANEESASMGCADMANLNPLYTLPPTAEQIEQETAEACAKVYLNTYDLTDIADDIRSGKWREYL